MRVQSVLVGISLVVASASGVAANPASSPTCLLRSEAPSLACVCRAGVPHGNTRLLAFDLGASLHVPLLSAPTYPRLHPLLAQAPG